MLARGHKITSVAVATGCLEHYHYVGLQNVMSGIVLMSGVVVGALLPDIDTKTSTISQFVKVPIYKMFKHRNQTHGLFAFVIFSGLLYFLLNYLFSFSSTDNQYITISFNLWLGLTIGYLLHLVEDSFSTAGIRWFAPVSQYDEWAYKNHGTYLRKVHHFKEVKVNGVKKNVPIRHWWGRGYVVGGQFEQFITVIMFILAVWFIVKFLINLI